MKKNLFAITGTMVLSLMAVILFTSCNERKQTKEEVSVEITGTDTVTNFTVYTYEEKNVALSEARKKLDEMNRQIDEWKDDANAKAGELSADAKAASDKAIADLERKRDEFKAEVEALENSTEDNWEEAKRDIGNKYDEVTNDLKRGWKNLKENVKETVDDAEEAIQ
jgi:F0F1-type ATP synthase membrane subunit b/b'